MEWVELGVGFEIFKSRSLVVVWVTRQFGLWGQTVEILRFLLYLNHIPTLYSCQEKLKYFMPYLKHFTKLKQHSNTLVY